MNAMLGPDVQLLDGSMGHELKERGLTESFTTAMFANVTHPDLVASVHEEYVAAGCTILTTNTFVLTPNELAKVGRAAELPSLLHAACACASRAAATGSGRTPILVAGCLPPLQHCYLPELVGTEAAMRAAYEEIVQELAPRVDLFLAETLCSSVEARAALQAAAPTNKPCWCSFTLHDDTSGPPTLRGGESIPQALAALDGARPPATLLFNCCAPQVVASALDAIPSAAPPGVTRFGGYANGFAQTTSEWLCESGAAAQGCSGEAHRFACPTCAAEYDDAGSITPEAYATHAQRWCERGASVVGGCCGIGPAHMRKVGERLGLRRSAEREGD